MGKMAAPGRLRAYRAGEVIFFLLIALYFSGGVLFFPASWFAVFDATPKIHRKLLAYVAGAAVILGLALLEWARRDKKKGTRGLLTKVIETWKTGSFFWITGFFVLFGSWWTASSCLRHESLNSGFDMAIFTQTIWNTTQGDWFYSSIKGGINLLGDHFAPLLVLVTIPYKIWPNPDLLLAMQAFSVASCVFPLAKIVRQSGQSSAWAVLFCLAFALYLPVRNAVRFEFHPEVFAMPLFFWAFAFLEEKRTFRASFFLALALMAKENIATVAFAFGLYACIKKEKQLGFGVFWMLASVLYFFAVVKILIPHFSGAPYFYLDGNFTAWIKIGWRPFIEHIFRTSTLTYLSKIYGPLAFTSVLAPATFLLTLPTLAQNLLSRNEMTRSIFFQYTATLTPFVFISSVYALSHIRQYRRYWAYLLLLTSVLMSGVSEIYPMRRAWLQMTPHTREVKRLLAGIPGAASLRTHEFYATHAANRKELHIYENNHPKEGGSWKARHTDYVVIDRALLNERYLTDRQTLLGNGFVIETEIDGLAILKRSDSNARNG